MAGRQRQRRPERSDEEVRREKLLTRPQLREAGVQDLMELYEEIEKVYTNTYYEPAQPTAIYSTSANL